MRAAPPPFPLGFNPREQINNSQFSWMGTPCMQLFLHQGRRSTDKCTKKCLCMQCGNCTAWNSVQQFVRGVSGTTSARKAGDVYLAVPGCYLVSRIAGHQTPGACTSQAPPAGARALALLVCRHALRAQVSTVVRSVPLLAPLLALLPHTLVLGTLRLAPAPASGTETEPRTKRAEGVCMPMALPCED